MTAKWRLSSAAAGAHERTGSAFASAIRYHRRLACVFRIVFGRLIEHALPLSPHIDRCRLQCSVTHDALRQSIGMPQATGTVPNVSRNACAEAVRSWVCASCDKFTFGHSASTISQMTSCTSFAQCIYRDGWMNIVSSRTLPFDVLPCFARDALVSLIITEAIREPLIRTESKISSRSA